MGKPPEARARGARAQMLASWYAHVSPKNCAGHAQLQIGSSVAVNWKLLHVPPFLHGVLAHASPSITDPVAAIPSPELANRPRPRGVVAGTARLSCDARSTSAASASVRVGNMLRLRHSLTRCSAMPPAAAAAAVRASRCKTKSNCPLAIGSANCAEEQLMR